MIARSPSETLITGYAARRSATVDPTPIPFSVRAMGSVIEMRETTSLLPRASSSATTPARRLEPGSVSSSAGERKPSRLKSTNRR